MYIFGVTRIEKDWRISIAGFFDREAPKGVVFVVKDGMIELIPENESKVGTIMIVDNKNRVTIPKWLREELPLETKKALFVYDEEKERRFIAPVGGKSILTTIAPN